MQKKNLRSIYLKRRDELSPQTLLDSSLSISNRLLELPIWEFDYYHIFLSIAQKKEIDTSFILTILQGRDKRIVVPKINGEHGLSHHLLTDGTKLVKNRWDVPEPLEAPEIDPKKLDVVFVPLLAFDKRGNRIGYGKGFYDRFLVQCRPETIKIGLSCFEAEEYISDVWENDIRLDHCVTPLQSYSFSTSS